MTYRLGGEGASDSGSFEARKIFKVLLKSLANNKMAIDIGFEVTKELAASVYQLVEKAKTGGKLRKGSNEVTKSIERNEAKLVVIAEDVNPPEIVMHLPLISAEKNIPVILVPAKEELGASVGLPVGTAAVAIVDAGAGKSLLATVIKNIEALRSEPAKTEKVEKEKPAKAKKKPEEKKERPKKEKKSEEKKETPKEKPVEVKKEKPETKSEKAPAEKASNDSKEAKPKETEAKEEAKGAKSKNK